MEWHLRVGWCAKRPHGLAPRVDGISGKMVPRVGWHLGEDGAPSGMAPRVGWECWVGWHHGMAFSARWHLKWDNTSGGLTSQFEWCL